MLIFEKSRKKATSTAHVLNIEAEPIGIPPELLRSTPLNLPSLSELEVVRHYTRLSQLNFSIDTHFYPLGSCTMKYNPRAAHEMASLPQFLNRHPETPALYSQAYLGLLYELQTRLVEITGMKAVTLAPLAGAQGELAGVTMIKAYHQSRNESFRDEMLVPDAAHGTNPASAAMAGFKIKEIKTKRDGDLDLDILKAALSERTAGIMLTNPSTLGVFERQIETVQKLVHDAGGLLYYDGANLNALLGKVRPGDMGFDVIHMNLHKTFATPHGGGGPGSGPVAVNEKLLPFLPIPHVVKNAGSYQLASLATHPHSIGRMSSFLGNAGILIRALIYIQMLGEEGAKEVSSMATLNANYLQACLSQMGYPLAYPTRRATHEFVVTLKEIKESSQVSALDVAKSLLDHGFHAPTVYFPLLVPECLLIEPTETESKNTLDAFLAAMEKIFKEIHTSPDIVRAAPKRFSCGRLDEIKAVKQLDVVFVE